MIKPTFLVFLLLSLTHLTHSRIVTENLISDGAADYRSKSPIVELNLTATTVTCEPIYGFLPCTTELWGELFLIVVYEYLLSLSDQYVAAGSELFFNMIGPGIFGASVFQVLGTIPVTVLMLVSGLVASADTAEEQAVMSMGFLAGSAVMLLTLIWGSCVAFGNTDLSKTLPSTTDTEIKKPFSFTGYGVSTDIETSYTARIMILSMLPFLILQLAKILNSSTGARVTILVSLFVTLAFILAYCFYQVFQPWIQNRRFEYLMNKYVKNKLLRLVTTNGSPNIAFMKELFHQIDKDKNAYISQEELRVLVLGIQLDEVGFNTDDFVEKVIAAFDTSGDVRIDEQEFVNGLLKYISESDARESVGTHHKDFKLFGCSDKSPMEEQQSLLIQRTKRQSTKKSWSNQFKAAFLLLLGTAITVILAQPLIEAISDFASAANISSFYVSYIVVPLALNYRLGLSAITSSRQKTQKAISLTLSEIYGAVFMNNMMGLATFLALIYIRNLAWDVPAEVLVVLIICTVMGIFTSLRTSFPLWTSFVAFFLYPISILMLYVLTTVCGWS
ncbi:Sodium/calcium exchanger NCL2 [Camellia lanceoleosa]|nr:Sodium/calcium exchanger NCL2 [Camellia lanceoleosa]